MASYERFPIFLRRDFLRLRNAPCSTTHCATARRKPSCQWSIFAIAPLLSEGATHSVSLVNHVGLIGQPIESPIAPPRSIAATMHDFVIVFRVAFTWANGKLFVNQLFG